MRVLPSYSYGLRVPTHSRSEGTGTFFHQEVGNVACLLLVLLIFFSPISSFNIALRQSQRGRLAVIITYLPQDAKQAFTLGARSLWRALSHDVNWVRALQLNLELGPYIVLYPSRYMVCIYVLLLRDGRGGIRSVHFHLEFLPDNERHDGKILPYRRVRNWEHAEWSLRISCHGKLTRLLEAFYSVTLIPLNFPRRSVGPENFAME